MSDLPPDVRAYRDSLNAQVASSPAASRVGTQPQASGAPVTITDVQVVKDPLFKGSTLRPSIGAGLEALEVYRQYLMKFADAEKDSIAGASAEALNHLLGDLEGGPYASLVAAVALAIIPRELTILRTQAVEHSKEVTEESGK